MKHIHFSVTIRYTIHLTHGTPNKASNPPVKHDVETYLTMHLLATQT